MFALPTRSWYTLSSACLLAALLSALQIYLRQWLADEQPAILRLVALNLVAWAPWLPLGALTVALRRRVPLDSRRGRVVHSLAAVSIAVVFLSYLALFRLLSLGQEIGIGAFGKALGNEVGDFFLVCLLLYGALLLLAQRWLPEPVPAMEPLPEIAAEPSPPRIEVRSLGRTRFVTTSEVDWISAEGSYVRLHVGGGSFLLRRSLSALTEELSHHGFIRVHRSSLVNRERVVAMRPVARGDAELELRDGTILRMSRRFRADFVRENAEQQSP